MAATGRLPITAKQIEKYVSHLRGFADRLQDVANDMKVAGRDSIDVMGQPTADLGLRYFVSLVQSCERVNTESTLGRGNRDTATRIKRAVSPIKKAENAEVAPETSRGAKAAGASSSGKKRKAKDS